MKQHPDYPYPVVWGHLPYAVWHTAYHKAKDLFCEDNDTQKTFICLYGSGYEDLSDYVMLFKRKKHADKWLQIIYDLLVERSVSLKSPLQWQCHMMGPMPK